MKLIDPKVELWSEIGISPESHIARCARVCYGHEDKAPNQEADEKMVDGLIKNGHLSMLRHASVYYVFPNKEAIPEELFSEYTNRAITADNKLALVSTNKQFVYERFANRFVDSSPQTISGVCQNNPELFSAFRLTFCITTQDAIAKELNRKSPNSIAEKSTRYCNFKDGIPVCRPHWMFGLQNWGNEDKRWELYNQLDDSVMQATKSYNALLEGGLKPEDARVVLPKVTATKVIYTYSVNEWEDILALRLYDKTGPAHPDCHIVMKMVRDQINTFAKEQNIEYEV